jgi:hypothetical protein
MSRRLISLALAAFLACSISLGAEKGIHDQEARDIDTAVSEIYQDFGTRNPLYIGVGRSPTPFIAELQTLFPGAALNVPLTSFRYRPGGPPSMVRRLSNKNETYRALTPEEEEKLFSHFDRYLKAPLAASGGRPILLLDYAPAGESLISAGEYLTRYLKARGFENKVTLVALCKKNALPIVEDSMKTTQLPYKAVLLPNNSQLVTNLSYQWYDQVSQYGAFNLKDSNVPKEAPQSSSDYETYRRCISDKLKEIRKTAPGSLP